MSARTSLRLVQPSGQYSPEGRSVWPENPQAKTREVFKGLVVASLDAGFLRYSKRQELMQLASRVGIGEFEACLLIAEAQYFNGDIDPVEFAETGLEHKPEPARISMSTRIALALGIATLIDIILVLWIF